MYQVAKKLYKMYVRDQKVGSPSEISQELIFTSVGLPAVIGDQNLYQKQFIQITDQAAEKIKSESFTSCLEYLAGERHNIAASIFGAENPFGIIRTNEGAWHTDIHGPYEKYLKWFFQSDKLGWEKRFSFSKLTYQMSATPKGKDPIELTSIEVERDQEVLKATWWHTSIQNIKPALEEAERLFNEARALKVSHDQKGLETVIKEVGALHWWLVQACPYQRGSAAIAKMMICALLKYHGIEPGGFGDIEPDCMALIQNPDEFIGNYSNLMRCPPPCWTPQEK
jgi:hypothetical protein